MSKVRIASEGEEQEQTEVHLCTGIVFRLILLLLLQQMRDVHYQFLFISVSEKGADRGN